METTELLERLSDTVSHGAVGLKMEFEAEGTRHYEYLRFLDLAKSVGLSITAKIGGCEAVSDLHTLLVSGANRIVAPMIESSYAAAKFVGMLAESKTIPHSIVTDFALMIETVAGFESRIEILDFISSGSFVEGIAFGRVDYASSLGKDRNAVESEIVQSSALELARLAQARGLGFTIGGAISPKSYASLLAIVDVHLTSFETRKVVFDSSLLNSSQAEFEKAISSSILFEAAWLESIALYEVNLADKYLERAKFLRDRASTK